MVPVQGIKYGQVYFIVNQVVKAILKLPGHWGGFPARYYYSYCAPSPCLSRIGGTGHLPVKRPGQYLFIKVDRYELPLGIIIVLISRHISPLLTKRPLAKTRSSIWRYYHAFRTFSTASTLTLSGRGKRVALSEVPLEDIVMHFHSLIPQSNFRPGPGNKLT